MRKGLKFQGFVSDRRPRLTTLTKQLPENVGNWTRKNVRTGQEKKIDWKTRVVQRGT
jgi:hypothetical protein